MDRKIINHLESLPYFTKISLLIIEDLKPKALSQNIQRWVDQGLLIRLKNGLYATKTYVDRSLHEERYFELIANKLVMPSYLSLEYVLQKRGLLTEGTYAITSVTSKSTRHYTNKLGVFTYSTLHRNLYFGFHRVYFGKNIIFEAELSKALFDYLYLRLSWLSLENRSTIEELRVNWSQLNKGEFVQFCKIIKKLK